MSVPASGYRWWYVDALGDDGRDGLTLIAFIGSVFSPYYAWSGRSDPLDHCAVNVAIYGPRNRWAMTERRRSRLNQCAQSLHIGPSSLAWEDGALVIRFDEVTAPWPSRVRGEVRLQPSGLVAESFELDAAGRHHWRPIAPRAEVVVALSHPAGGWRGQGYFDTNWGDEPLEAGFSAWTWSRAHRARDTLLFYDVVRRGGEASQLALRIAADGMVEAIDPPSAHALPPTGWRMPRLLRCDADNAPTLQRTLEDTPFYARSLAAARYGGELASVMHESLSLDRLRSPLVGAMLPFRMPRAFW